MIVTTEDQQALAAARRGEAELRKIMPRWFEQVDLGTLNMGSTCNCVLGQTFGDFQDGLDLLELDESARWYGFDKPPDGEWDYFDLEIAWTQLIQERLGAGAET